MNKAPRKRCHDRRAGAENRERIFLSSYMQAYRLSSLGILTRPYTQSDEIRACAVQ